jgi:hypothetical protein
MATGNFLFETLKLLWAMKYHSGKTISLGDRMAYNGQEGCVALIGRDPKSGTPLILPKEWDINDAEILILFDNGARLVLGNVPADELLVFLNGIIN